MNISAHERVRLFVVAVLIACAVACTPTQNIKPLPNFVSVALEPGDRVIVTTHGGESHEFVITEIRSDILLGANEQFKLRDIASIQKYAWERPDTPCGGDKPLGCSMPFLISLASEEHSHYQEEFYDACAQHDYCYRHGFASYGLNRESCDDEFLNNMQNSCPSAATGTLGKVFEVMNDSVESRQNCLRIADDYHRAVHRYGEDKFLTTTSTYCEYNGPPQTPVAPGAASAAEFTNPGF